MDVRQPSAGDDAFTVSTSCIRNALRASSVTSHLLPTLGPLVRYIRMVLGETHGASQRAGVRRRFPFNSPGKVSVLQDNFLLAWRWKVSILGEGSRARVGREIREGNAHQPNASSRPPYYNCTSLPFPLLSIWRRGTRARHAGGLKW